MRDGLTGKDAGQGAVDDDDDAWIRSGSEVVEVWYKCRRWLVRVCGWWVQALGIGESVSAHRELIQSRSLLCKAFFTAVHLDSIVSWSRRRPARRIPYRSCVVWCGVTRTHNQCHNGVTSRRRCTRLTRVTERCGPRVLGSHKMTVNRLPTRI